MHIEIIGAESYDPQARTYAEYRLFAALAQVVDTSRVRHARLVLRRVTEKRHAGTIACEVTVDIRDGGVLRVKAIADHPYGAINRAMARIAREGGERLS